MATADAPSYRLQEAMAKIVWRLGRAESRARMLGDAARDLSPTDEHLLRTIVANGPVRMSDLAAGQGVDKSTVTPQVRRLEHRDLIKRSSDANDGRVVLLTATSRGRRTCQRMDTTAVAVISEALRDWSHADRETLATLFSRFADDLTGEQTHR
jgi:DNA-binding MarR family transcriptional regulator